MKSIDLRGIIDTWRSLGRFDIGIDTTFAIQITFIRTFRVYYCLLSFLENRRCFQTQR